MNKKEWRELERLEHDYMRAVAAPICIDLEFYQKSLRF